MEYTDETLEDKLTILANYNEVLIRYGVELLKTHGIFPFDHYCGAILNRTLNLNKGFINQLKDHNFIAAAPLVRLNLDSLLRLFAAFQVDYSIDEFASKIIRGEAFSILEDKNGKLMKDHYLVKQLSAEKGYDWVKTIYKAGNEYVHFTSQHISASIKVDKSTNPHKIKGIIQLGDSFIEMKEKVWATLAMVKINEGILKHLDKWIKYKSKIDLKK
jgi:hypothetical protein